MSKFRYLTSAVLLVALTSAHAQEASPPPVVGIVRVERRPVTETSEFLGRIQAVERVDIVPRVTAFLTRRLFTEGAEVKKGDLLYELEREPFQADVRSRQAAVKQVEAQLLNATQARDRAEQLLKTSAGTVATFDTARANEQSQQAQLLAAKAQLRQSEINLEYTEIRSPIDGKIGRTAVTEGNVVSPASGALTSIVSQDPMYVVFPVPVRTAFELREKVSKGEGFDALKVKLKLPDGRVYEPVGKLDFLNNSVSGNTDTLTMRAVIANPAVQNAQQQLGARELLDSQLVTVSLQAAESVSMLTIPRLAVLADQAGDFVYVVDADGTAVRRSIKLNSTTTPTLAVLDSGLEEGEQVVVEGLQRVRPGQKVSAAPAEPPPNVDSRK